MMRSKAWSALALLALLASCDAAFYEGTAVKLVDKDALDTAVQSAVASTAAVPDAIVRPFALR